MREAPDFFTRVHNIPCGVVVDHFHSVPPFQGPARLAVSDLDYYGYTDIDWHLIDRKGYPAAWLERLLTPSERTQIETIILEQHNAY